MVKLDMAHELGKAMINALADGGMLDAFIAAGGRYFRLSNDESFKNIQRLYNEYMEDPQSKEKLDALEGAEEAIMKATGGINENSSYPVHRLINLFDYNIYFRGIGSFGAK